MSFPAVPRVLELAIRVVAIAVVAVVALGAFGFVAFTRASEDPVAEVDAIVVLGGEHDGRELYGVELARSGVSDTVVLSDPYQPGDALMSELCVPRSDGIEVICRQPDPSTTRGEAIFTEELAQQRGWTSVLVISWRYHLPRARFIFGQCFSGQVAMTSVPRSYDYSIVAWELTYLYQVAAFAKAAVQGSCAGAERS